MEGELHEDEWAAVLDSGRRTEMERKDPAELLQEYALPPGWPIGQCGRPIRALIDSTILRSMAYVPAAQILEVERRGKYYRDILQYHDVPQIVWDYLWAAPQKATVYFTMIENQYRCTKTCNFESYFARPPWVMWEEMEAVAQEEEQKAKKDKSKKLATQWGFSQ